MQIKASRSSPSRTSSLTTWPQIQRGRKTTNFIKAPSSEDVHRSDLIIFPLSLRIHPPVLPHSLSLSLISTRNKLPSPSHTANKLFVSLDLPRTSSRR